MRRFIASLTLSTTLVLLTSVLMTPSVVTAQQNDDLGKIDTRLQVPIPLLTTKEGYITITPRTIAEYVLRIYNFLLIAAAVIAVVMLVWGGFMWMTAGGGAERVGKAQEYIWNAIAGLIILFGAYLILSIVNPKLTTLKSLDLKPIKPMALSSGLFCKDRVDAFDTLLSDRKIPEDKKPELQFTRIQQRAGRTIIDRTAASSEDIQSRDDNEWFKINESSPTKRLVCGDVYAIRQVTPGSDAQILNQTPCFGHTCSESLILTCFPDAQGKGQPGCKSGALSGTITYSPNRGGVDYIKLKTMYGASMINTNTSPSDTSYRMETDRATMNSIAGMDPQTLFFIEVEIDEGTFENDDLYYLGKDGKRFSFFNTKDTANTPQCRQITGVLETNQKVSLQYSDPLPCSQILWDKLEIISRGNFNIDISDENIFFEDHGEDGTKVIPAPTDDSDHEIRLN